MADTQEELTPVDVIVDNIKITSTNGKKQIDITDLVNAIDINEALFTPILTGVMLITDAAGLLTELPVLSQEKITFDITKPGSGERAFTKSCEFRVRQIDKSKRYYKCLSAETRGRIILLECNSAGVAVI